MNIRAWIGAGTIALGVTFAVSCGDDDGPLTGPTVGSILLQLEADTLAVDGTTQVQATVLSVDGETLTDETLTFTSSNEDIITVSNTGLVTAVGPGTATVTARSDDIIATVTVTVTAFVRRAASISVAPSDTTLQVDDELTLAVTVLDADGVRIRKRDLRASSSNSAVVDVGLLANGHVSIRAVSGGNSVITVETEGLTAQADITVLASEVRAVILLPDSLTLAVGDTARLTVQVQDTTGFVIADPHVLFQCDCHHANDILIASVDSTGLVTGVSPGSALVIARSRGVVSDATRVTVETGGDSGVGWWDY